MVWYNSYIAGNSMGKNSAENRTITKLFDVLDASGLPVSRQREVLRWVSDNLNGSLFDNVEGVHGNDGIVECGVQNGPGLHEADQG
jgi:hypothetical protein